MKKLLALLTAAIMIVTLALPVAAEKYDGIDATNPGPIVDTKGTTTTFDKYLVMDKEAQVPYVDFLYTVSAPDPDNDDDDEVYPEVLIPATTEPNDPDPSKDVKPVVWKGVRPDKVKVKTAADTEGKNVKNKLTFTPEDTTVNGQYREDKGDIANGREKYVKKEITLDFSAIKFAEPGVYRYYLQESNGTAADGCIYDDLGIDYDVNAADANENWRTVDVYVHDGNGEDSRTDGELYVADYVWYEGKLGADKQPSHTASATNENAWKPGTEWTDTTVTPNEKYVYVSNNIWRIEIPDTENPGQWVDSGRTASEPSPAAQGSVTIDNKPYTTFATAKAAMEDYLSKTLTPNGAEASTPKSSEFVNKYGTADLEFGKKVEGNQGSRDQWFEFKVTLTTPTGKTLPDGTRFEMNVGAYTSTNPANAAHFFAPTKNSATSYEASAMTTANTVNATYFLSEVPATDPVTYDNTFKVENNTGKNFLISKTNQVEWTLYLQHGQYIQIKGIPYGMHYKVEETDPATGYTKKAGTDVAPGVIDGEVITNAHKDPVEDDIKAHKTTITYVQDDEGLFYKNGNAYNQLYKGDDDKVYTDSAKTIEYTGPVSDRYAEDDNVYTGWTNIRDGVIPTGVAMGIGGALVLLALAAVYFIVRRRNVAYED